MSLASYHCSTPRSGALTALIHTNTVFYSGNLYGLLSRVLPVLPVCNRYLSPRFPLEKYNLCAMLEGWVLFSSGARRACSNPCSC